ncbi:MAG: hypothetical protein AAF400_02020 [Bacteroidota bacterium]
MNVRTIRQSNFYTQDQRCAARILLTVCLLLASSPAITLAVPEAQEAIVPATTTSLPGQTAPRALSLPIDRGPGMDTAPQRLTSQKADLELEGHDLRRTSLEVHPVGSNLSSTALGGETVRFFYQEGKWRAAVSSRLGTFSRQVVLPVVSGCGEDVTGSLAVLSKRPSWYRQRQIHVLGRNLSPTLEEVVYVGELGLKGGVEGEASGSGEQEVSPPSLSRSSLDLLREQIAAGKSPEEVYPLIADRLADPKKTFTRSEQISLLTDCVRYGQVNAEAIKGKDAVIVLGNTGAGKSTFINYLAGCQFKRDQHKSRPVLEVQSRSSGGDRDEVMPIGHVGSKTFIPQVAEVDGITYGDCPGFNDNRGVEINIANAVNIKQVLSGAKSLRMVVLVDFPSLTALRGQAFEDLLATLIALLGNKETIPKYEKSLLLGISKCPHAELTGEEVWEGYMDGYVSDSSLSFLRDRLFIFDPLSLGTGRDHPAGWWSRQDCLKALGELEQIPSSSSILSVSLSDSDKNALHDIGASIEEELGATLSQGDVVASSAHFRCLERLLVIEHEKIEQLLTSARDRISSWLREQELRFCWYCAAHNFSEAERLLSVLGKASTSFSFLTLDLSSLHLYLEKIREISTALATLKSSEGRLQENGYVLLPKGSIIMWSGKVDEIPAGWVLCDGQKSSPDLRSRFIVGAGEGKDLSNYTVGSHGGEEYVTLKKSQMPRHNHTGNVGGDGYHRHSVRGGLHKGKPIANDRVTTSPDGEGAIIDIFDGGSHGHTIPSDGDNEAHENRPPYYALCFIMKT